MNHHRGRPPKSAKVSASRAPVNTAHAESIAGAKAREKERAQELQEKRAKVAAARAADAKRTRNSRPPVSASHLPAPVSLDDEGAGARTNEKEKGTQSGHNNNGQVPAEPQPPRQYSSSPLPMLNPPHQGRASSASSHPLPPRHGSTQLAVPIFISPADHSISFAGSAFAPIGSVSNGPRHVKRY